MNRIIVFLHDYNISGANRSFLDYVSHFDKNQYYIEAVIPRKKAEMYHELNKLGIKCIIANYFIINKKLYKTSFNEKISILKRNLYNGVFAFNTIKKLEKYIKENNFDCVITNSISCMYGAIISKKLNLPHTFHIREFMEKDHQISNHKRYKPKELTNYSNGICISNCVYDYYKKKNEFKDLKIIYNQINMLPFIKNRELFYDGTIEILIAGTLQEKKGQYDAIRAIDYVNTNSKYNIELFICGDGPLKNKLEKYCINNNIYNIHFLGNLDYKNLMKLRENIDISLTCSEYEALGRTTIESMLYESITIGTNCGETPCLLDDERGLIYNYGDFKDLANKILYAIENRDKMEFMISKAKKYAEKEFTKNIYKDIFDYALRK